MPLTSEEFRSLLSERSSGLDVAPDHLSRVHRGIVRRRRRAVAAVAGAAAMIVAAVAVVPMVVSSRHERVPVAVTPTPALYESSAPYSSGGKLLAGGVL